MALEQTINAKTKNRLKGITAYVYVASAVNRWVVVNSLRSQLVNPLLKLVDLKHATDGNKKLQQSQTEKDKCDLDDIKQVILYADGWRASFKVIYFFFKTLMTLL